MRPEQTAAGELQLDNQLCFLLYALARRSAAQYRPLLEPLGLTYPQYLVLLVLWEAQGELPAERFDGVTLKFVGERLLLDSGTLTPLLKRLETAGLLSRSRSSSDEREIRLRLTAAGLALREPIAGGRREMACDSPLPVARMGALHRELRALLQAVVSD